MADGEDGPEFEVDQQLSESHKFALYKDREGYHSLGHLVCPFKTSREKGKRLGRTVAKIQLFA